MRSSDEQKEVNIENELHRFALSIFIEQSKYSNDQVEHTSNCCETFWIPIYSPFFTPVPVATISHLKSHS